jgi:nitrogen fixation-related uncharacterized protein
MKEIYYIIAIISEIWPIALIMGIISIPILTWTSKREKQYEPLTNHYNTTDSSISLIDGSKVEIKENETNR